MEEKNYGFALITREMLELGIVTDEILDKIEEYKASKEWFEIFKHSVQKACEENSIKKWETDYFSMIYIEETKSPKIDTDRMKNTMIYIADAVTGELVEVNAYEFFTKKSAVKAHMTFKEKK